MQRMLAATPLSSGRSDLAHRTRAFNRPPDADQAAMLLVELATAPCAYSPVVADMPLTVYGAGNLGRLARDFLAVLGHKLVMVIDRDARRLLSSRRSPCQSQSRRSSCWFHILIGRVRPRTSPTT